MKGALAFRSVCSSAFDITDLVGDLGGELGEGEFLSFNLDLSVNWVNTESLVDWSCNLINLGADFWVFYLLSLNNWVWSLIVIA